MLTLTPELIFGVLSLALNIPPLAIPCSRVLVVPLSLCLNLPPLLNPASPLSGDLDNDLPPGERQLLVPLSVSEADTDLLKTGAGLGDRFDVTPDLRTLVKGPGDLDLSRDCCWFSWTLKLSIWEFSDDIGEADLSISLVVCRANVA